MHSFNPFYTNLTKINQFLPVFNQSQITYHNLNDCFCNSFKKIRIGKKYKS